MSKNEQMTRIGSHRTRGVPGLVQGAYGAAGNLELVVPDHEDGLWVFWFNADPPGTEPVGGIESGQWSAGLAFATGARYDAAAIHQTRRGPDFLEVIAATDGLVESWYWSPGPGFQRRGGTIPGSGRLAIEETPSGFQFTVGDRLVTADASRYPELNLRAGGTAEAAPPDAVEDRSGIRVVATGERVVDGGVEPGSLATARSTRAGGTLELVWRDDSGELRHLGVPAP